jgi:aminoglycoside 6-adenylyltransferase
MKSFEQRVITWAKARPDIRAILVVGSSARRDHPSDEWSDLDLMIFTTDLKKYLTGIDDLDQIGHVWVSVPYEHNENFLEHLVLFEGGHKVDFCLFHESELDTLIQHKELPHVYQRGYYIVLDKDGLAAKMPPSLFGVPVADLPSPEVFNATVNMFWYSALRMAKQLRRRDLWAVKFSDNIMKEHLLRLIEWHARAQHGIAHDTWHDGRFMSEWVDEQTWTTLFAAFGHFDAADSWRALLTTMDLFHRLATETALLLGFPYPEPLDTNITSLVNQLHAGDTTGIDSPTP